MMAYQNGFVVSIIHNGHPVRETRGEDGLRTCVLPFGSEYKIRLKNTGLDRAKVTVLIDGTPVFSGDKTLLLGCNETVDLERFVSSLDKGRRFKFVPSSHAEVQDPTSQDNGVIRVTFQPVCSKIVEATPSWVMTPLNHAFARTLNCCTSTSGATIEGSHSEQSFSMHTGDLISAGAPVTITLRLVGEEKRDKPWLVSENAVYYEGKFLRGVDTVIVSSSGTTIIFLNNDAVIG